MVFKRLMALILCFMAAFCVVAPIEAEAAGGHHFKKFEVQNSMGVTVSVKVESNMFKGDDLIFDSWMYTEEQWIDIFVRNILVGEKADKITKVVLCSSSPHKTSHKSLVCPPILPGEHRFLAYLSGPHTLMIVCHDISSTLCDSWHLNESGLALFGR